MTMRASASAGLLVTAAVAGCGNPPPGETFFDRNIQPVLTQSCSRGTGPCHEADPDDPFQAAAGTFDVTQGLTLVWGP